MKFEIDNVTREALIYPPRVSNATMTKYPVIFGFHGHGGTMKSADKQMQLEKYWPDAIIVYMQGLPTPGIAVDPEGKQTGWQHLPGQENDRDLKFFDSVLATLSDRFAVDDKRIYVAGFSNGAYFSYLLWAKRASRIAAFGICAGRIVESIQLTTPRSLIAISGRNDDVVEFEQQMNSIGIVRSLVGATHDGVSCGKGCTNYQGSGGLSVVTLINNEGHSYPANASSMIVEFFKAHARR